MVDQTWSGNNFEVLAPNRQALPLPSVQIHPCSSNGGIGWEISSRSASGMTAHTLPASGITHLRLPFLIEPVDLFGTTRKCRAEQARCSVADVSESKRAKEYYHRNRRTPATFQCREFHAIVRCQRLIPCRVVFKISVRCAATQRRVVQKARSDKLQDRKKRR